ncbi:MULTISPECIES: SulP family inorganic anion transporter [Alteromonadaceae]|uniref:SulP family inorganic anion transporter n=1 Tax=Brumicola blandensis TaxID=3075611 RepID=A0AAW8QXQ0_9ALTE|nr:MULTISPECIES: SulP family inorganic anion transporter [unclassified Alteromonas]MDT0581876.1 SulP family inorganic anion transporter [Alteromonas sp. W409]MDT0628447.1 SulP family inorganic anion transporter [Alteromonas sp. W364]
MQIFNTINRSNLRGDILGGVTAAIVSLPLALTFGVASGVGPEAGLYGAIIIGLFASLFGGTPTLISEPTGPMTVIMAAVVTTLIADNPDNGLAMAFTVVMIAGLTQIAFGVMKLGKYITMMPYSVISGFMSGIGCILIVMQLAPAMGSAAPSGGVSGTLTSLPEIISNISFVELGMALATIAILFLTPKKLKNILPPQLIALVMISIVSVIFFQSVDIRRIGEINVSLPSLVLPEFTPEQIKTMVLDGIVLGMLGCIDSMLTSVIADNLTRSEHKSDKELIGQGVGNMMSGLFGGLPGAGATMGTVVNIQAGAKTALSGLVRVSVLVVAIFGASGLISVIPIAVLAGIAVKVGIDILDWSFIKRAHKVSKQSSLIMYAVLLLTVFVDLVVAVGIGVFIANIITIEKLSASQAKNIKAISDVDGRLPLTIEQRQLLNKANGEILFFYLSGTMIFGVSKALSRELSSMTEHKVIIIDLSDVSFLDDTIALAIENLIKDANQLEKHIIMLVKQDSSKKKLQKMGFTEILPPDAFVQNRTEALTKATEWLGHH